MKLNPLSFTARYPLYLPLQNMRIHVPYQDLRDFVSPSNVKVN